MTANYVAPQFTDETAAIAHVEASRWPDGVNCPLCGSVNVHRMGGLTQAGMFLCNDCREKFTCRTKTVMERSHIPVHKWLYAIHLMSSSKKGVSAHQLHRTLGITYKSAWFLAHRIREAMRDPNPAPIGGEGKQVEIDETAFGSQEGTNRKTKRIGWQHRNIVLNEFTDFEQTGQFRQQLVPIFRGHWLARRTPPTGARAAKQAARPRSSLSSAQRRKDAVAKRIS